MNGLADEIADVLRAADGVLEPLEVLSPAEWAEKHVSVEGGPFPGPWDNQNGPHLIDPMNAVHECLVDGKNLVCIKGAQEGLTQALGVNAVAWLIAHFGGPVLYLTNKDSNAKKVSRDRWAHVLKTCEPIRRKHLAGKLHGELILEKRFTDGSLTMSGSKSLLNFLSNPYAVVVFDELDSCQDSMPDGSDPVALVVERLTAMAEGRPVIIIAFAHPTTRDRGAAKLYYSESDQRRAHVECPHCNQWFAPLWEHVQVVPREGQSPQAAARDPSCYHLAASCCGAILSEADRLRMIRKVRQLPTLAPDVLQAKKPKWVGIHVWHLFLQNAGIVEELAKKHIAGIDDEGKRIVFRNKVCGDAYDLDEQENPDEEAWRTCISLPRFDGDTASYYRGEVPSEVQVLTAGTDHGKAALHWVVWGWALLRVFGGGQVLCGWLIDWGEIRRDPPAEGLDVKDLRPFDALLYDRVWVRRDGRELRVLEGAHDTGWEPDAVNAYTAQRPSRSISIKGASDDAFSLAPLFRHGQKPVRMIKGAKVKHPDALGVANTFLAKRLLYGRVRKRVALDRGEGQPPEQNRWRLHLPIDVDDEVVRQLSAERLVVKGLSRRKLQWKKIGPNHYGDCSVYSLVLAETLANAQGAKTRMGDALPVAKPLEPAPAAPSRQIVPAPVRPPHIDRSPRIRREY